MVQSSNDGWQGDRLGKLWIRIRFESVYMQYNKDGILFEHIGLRLGLLIKEKLLDLKWIKNYNDNLFLTEKGENGLESLGVKIKKISVNLY